MPDVETMLSKPLECCSTHCERAQECRDIYECCGDAKGKAMAALERARKELSR